MQPGCNHEGFPEVSDGRFSGESAPRTLQEEGGLGRSSSVDPRKLGCLDQTPKRS